MGLLYALAWIGAFLWPALVVLIWRDARRRRGGYWSLARTFWTMLFSLGWIVCVWAFHIEPELLVVRHVTLRSAAWDGPPVRIGLISDTHAGGPHGSVRRIARIVARMNAEKPDLVVLLGDYVAGHAPARERSARANATIAAGISAFGQLAAPLGRVAVYGNHDWWYDGSFIAQDFRNARTPLLENEARRIDRPGGAFWIVGLADEASRHEPPSFERALQHVPEGDDVIAIGHRPDIFYETPARVAATLAAHSHCGQVKLPVIGRPFLPSLGSKRWPCGAYTHRGRLLYVTGGAGVSAVPARFGAPPEIVVVTLRGD